MRFLIMVYRLFFTATILCVFIGCGYKEPPPRSEGPSTQRVLSEADQLTIEKNFVEPPDTIPTPVKEEEADKTVIVKGYAAIIDDIQKAHDEAMMDAYNNAIASGLGVQVYGKTVVKQYQVVEHFVMAEQKGYVKSFKILDTNKDGPLGYEVTVEAVVSSKPISKFDDLKFLVRLLGNPRLMVFVESENRSVVEGYLMGPLKEADYQLIDREQMERLRERDFKEKELAGDPEAAATLGNQLGADISIVGNITAEVTTRLGGEMPFIVATARGGFKAIVTETAEIIYVVSDADIPQDKRQGKGNTEAKAIGEAIENSVGEAARKLAWELSGKIGLITVKLRVLNCSYQQSDQLIKYLSSLRIVENVNLRNWQNSIAEIDVETTRKTRNLMDHLLKFGDADIELQRFGLGTIEIKILKFL